MTVFSVFWFWYLVEFGDFSSHIRIDHVCFSLFTMDGGI